MTESFTFHPAPDREAQSFRLEAGLLEAPRWKLDLSEVTGAGWVSRTTRGQRTAWLALEHHHGTVRRIALSLPEAGWPGSDDARAFLALVCEVLDRLAGGPADEVEIGERGGARRRLFVIGLIAALAGPALFVAALVGGVDSENLMAASIPMLLMFLIGAMVATTASPWRSLPGVPAAKLAAALRDLAAPATG